MELGPDAWCDGHLDEAVEVLRWVAALPPYADTVVTLWWVATGEVRTGPPLAEAIATLPAEVRSDLPPLG